MWCNVMSMWRLRWHFTRHSPLQGNLTILKLQSLTQLNTMAKSMMTGTVPSSGRSVSEMLLCYHHFSDGETGLKGLYRGLWGLFRFSMWCDVIGSSAIPFDRPHVRIRFPVSVRLQLCLDLAQLTKYYLISFPYFLFLCRALD